MQMRPAIQIKSVIKALTDVVLPALDPNNKPAQEQIRLAIGMLTLMGQQLPLQFQFDCDELARLLELSQALQQQARGGEGTSAALSGLAAAAVAAGVALEGAKTSPEQLLQNIKLLRARAGSVITAAYRDGDPTCLDRVRDTVLAMSKEQLLRDRSWLLMQNWEPDPKAVPAIADLLNLNPTQERA